MKDSLIEIKNNSQGNSSVNEADNQISDLEHKEVKNKQTEQEKRIQKTSDSVSSLCDNFKHSNICIIGVAEGEEKGQNIRNLLEKNSERKLP